MAGNENFDREYRVTIGKAGGAGSEIGERSKSQPVPLHVNFSIERTDLETQNTGRLTIWNLNKQHLAALDEKDCCVVLKAGYKTRMALIFAGIVSNAATSQDGGDIKTEIEVIDNLVEIRDTYVSLTYTGTVNWKTIFDDVAGQMGVAVTYSYNAEFVDIHNGFSFIGLARDIMTKGCACCNLAWSLQNGVMQVKKPGDVMSKEVFVLSPETGLIGSPVRVTEAASETNANPSIGWEVDFFLNGAINIDDYVKLESKNVTGFFRVAKLSIQGDNLAGDWMCSAKLMELAGQGG